MPAQPFKRRQTIISRKVSSFLPSFYMERDLVPRNWSSGWAVTCHKSFHKYESARKWVLLADTWGIVSKGMTQPYLSHAWAVLEDNLTSKWRDINILARPLWEKLAFRWVAERRDPPWWSILYSRCQTNPFLITVIDQVVPTILGDRAMAEIENSNSRTYFLQQNPLLHTLTMFHLLFCSPYLDASLRRRCVNEELRRGWELLDEEYANWTILR